MFPLLLCFPFHCGLHYFESEGQKETREEVQELCIQKVAAKSYNKYFSHLLSGTCTISFFALQMIIIDDKYSEVASYEGAGF